MNRRKFLKNFGLSAGALALTGYSRLSIINNRQKKYTNFVIVLTDDQGYADLGCYGAKGFTTPNIDLLAKQGIKLTDFCVSQPVCSASRASLLTGCYANRVGIHGALNPIMPSGKTGIHSREKTIAGILKEKGYATGVFGKWHLGHHKKFLPLQHGFDEYLGLPYSNDMWPVNGHKYKDTKNSKYPYLPLIDGNEIVDYIDTLEDQNSLTTRYTQRAVRFVEKNKDNPFFLYMPHSMPHVPLGVSDKFRGKSRQGLYGDVIMEIDWSVGQIMDTLKKNNLEDNTLVIFTSDNGPWLNFGNHAGSAYPLREGKGTTWEGGVRTPCVMRWPSHIQPNSQCDKMIASIDILPTIAEISHGRLPGHKIDGVSVLALLEGDENANPRNHFFYYYHNNQLEAVRKGKWKLYFPHISRSYQGVKPGNDGCSGSYSKLKVGLELYNLEEDVSETTNLVMQLPEVVEELKILAEKARNDMGDRLTQKQGENIRSAGKI